MLRATSFIPEFECLLRQFIGKIFGFRFSNVRILDIHCKWNFYNFVSTRKQVESTSTNDTTNKTDLKMFIWLVSDDLESRTLIFYRTKGPPCWSLVAIKVLFVCFGVIIDAPYYFLTFFSFWGMLCYSLANAI